MKICLVAHGGNVFAWQHARAFQAHGHAVRLLSLGPASQRDSDVPVQLFSPPGFDPSSDGGRWSYAKTILPVRKAIADWKPDIVFALYLSSAGVVASFSGHPRLVVSARGCDVNRWIGVQPWPMVFRAQAAVAKLVHTVSQPLCDVLVSRARVPRRKVRVAPLGIDTTRFVRFDPRMRPGTGRMICTRSHDDVYDQPTLLRAMQRLQRRRAEYHLTFAHPRKADVTRQLAHHMGLEGDVSFLPGYTLEQLPLLLGRQDLYVSASLRDGTSSSLLEAMSTGLLPVVSDIEANREWIDHGVNGLLFPVGDDEALADLVERAGRDTDLVRRASTLNPMLVRERGDLTAMTRRLLSMFEELM